MKNDDFSQELSETQSKSNNLNKHKKINKQKKDKVKVTIG